MKEGSTCSCDSCRTYAAMQIPQRQRTCKLASLQMFARSACSQLWYNSWCLGLRQHLGHQQRLTLTLLTRCKMSDAGGSGTKLAGRRPDWALPSLHDGLKMDSHAPLEESTAAGRQQCPQWCVDCTCCQGHRHSMSLWRTLFT